MIGRFASVVFRRLMKRPRFGWSRDGEALLREVKPGCFDAVSAPALVAQPPSFAGGEG
jgi:hypothetical protein